MDCKKVKEIVEKSMQDVAEIKNAEYKQASIFQATQVLRVKAAFYAATAKFIEDLTSVDE